MTSWNVAVMAMIGISAMGFLFAEGERTRVRYIQAMRKCLMRMSDLIRYEQPELRKLLLAVHMDATPQERQLTALLHASAKRLDRCVNPQLTLLFLGESSRAPGYGVLSEEDRATFETLLGELGRSGLEEQLRLIDCADERLRAREEELRRESVRRARLIRALGLTGGAAAFLILV